MTRIILVCKEENDLFQALLATGIPVVRHHDAAAAGKSATADDALLVLADGYPQQTTDIPADVLSAPCPMYLEFPTGLPGMPCADIRTTEWERLVVTTDAFGPDLARDRILMAHGCRYIAAESSDSLLAVARIAGFDTAVYGLPDEASPILFRHDTLNALVATTALSHFVTGRYAPAAAWGCLWTCILSQLTGDDVPALTWRPHVAPAWDDATALTGDARRQATLAGGDWFFGAKLLVHPDWPESVPTGCNGLPEGVAPGPGDEWPCGDGSHGLIEGASSHIHPDGSQDWRYHIRSDCMGEASMALAFRHRLSNSPRHAAASHNLNEFIYHTSLLAQGPRACPESPSYGLVCWTGNDAHGGIYYGDDNARMLLGSLAAAAVLEDSGWHDPMARCLVGNVRTTGPLGFRGKHLNEPMLQEKGWRHFATTERTVFAPHYESWLWACYLWAYAQSGIDLFRERATAGIRHTMAAYPNEWQWTNGIQQERARMLLPLAWLLRVEDTEEHREWIRFMANELLQAQDACGGIREEVGSAGKGSYAPPASNDAYGTTEAPLIQDNGDPLCDLLYTTNFAFIGLHEAAAVLDDDGLRRHEARLSEFLCRIQVHSDRHRELHGGWFRAFDMQRWDYWASNADLGWGAWCIESGWTQSWIVATLALQELDTSLWEATQTLDLADALTRAAETMLTKA